MSLRYIEIAERNQFYDVPLAAWQLQRLAAICQLTAGTRLLDLACGKGEMLVQWARAYDLQGTGVDADEARIDIALQRANELEVWSQLNFVASDVAAYPQPFHQYNLVSCLNMAGEWASIPQMIATMREALKDDAGGLLLVGAAYWQAEPTPESCAALGLERSALPTLGELADQFEEAQTDLAEMVLTRADDWDTYSTQQWQTCLRWLHDNPDHADTAGLQTWLAESRRRYLRYERHLIGWGVFVLEASGRGLPPVPQEKMRFDWQEE